MSKKAIPTYAWFIPLLPIAFTSAIYFGEIQASSFLILNRFAQILPDTLLAWLTFLGNGWGLFALLSPLLLLAPRVLSAGLFAGAISGISSSFLKRLFDLPRPAGLLENGSFHIIGETLSQRAMPSGHTLTAFAVASGLYFSVAPEKRKSLSFVFVIAACVGFSRIGVGAHWLTDVLAGAGVGLWCGMLGANLARYIPESALYPQRTWPRLIALGGVAAIYVHFTQVMDLELNLPLQYASIAILVVTLVFFIRAQFSQPSSS